MRTSLAWFVVYYLLDGEKDAWLSVCTYSRQQQQLSALVTCVVQATAHRGPVLRPDVLYEPNGRSRDDGFFVLAESSTEGRGTVPVKNPTIQPTSLRRGLC